MCHRSAAGNDNVWHLSLPTCLPVYRLLPTKCNRCSLIAGAKPAGVALMIFNVLNKSLPKGYLPSEKTHMYDL